MATVATYPLQLAQVLLRLQSNDDTDDIIVDKDETSNNPNEEGQKDHESIIQRNDRLSPPAVLTRWYSRIVSGDECKVIEYSIEFGIYILVV